VKGVDYFDGAKGLNWATAPWAALTTYAKDDALQFNGNTYIAINAITGNIANLDPSVDAANWQIMAAQGIQGPKGDNGTNGTNGTNGINGTNGTNGANGANGSPDTPAQVVAKIATGGKVGIFTTNPLTPLHVSETAMTSIRGETFAQHSDSTHAAVVVMMKSRGTELLPTTVLSGDYILAFQAQAFDGSAYQNSASLNSVVDGTPSLGSVPQAFAIFTGTNSINKSEQMRVSSSGNIGIGTTTPTQKLDVAGAVRINSGVLASRPNCDSNIRGTFWFAQGASGTKDSATVCAKDAADAYAWRTIY
jgi:hypothetical protein